MWTIYDSGPLGRMDYDDSWNMQNIRGWACMDCEDIIGNTAEPDSYYGIYCIHPTIPVESDPPEYSHRGRLIYIGKTCGGDCNEPETHHPIWCPRETEETNEVYNM